MFLDNGAKRIHLCEQKISAGLSHEFFEPDVTPKIFARFDWLGTFRDDGDDRSAKAVIDREQEPKTRGRGLNV